MERHGISQRGRATTKLTSPNSPPSQGGDEGVVKIFIQKSGFKNIAKKARFYKFVVQIQSIIHKTKKPVSSH